MNYTHPNNENYNDDSKDWLFGALLFSKTLSLMIEPGQGIIIELENDMLDLYPNSKKVLVYNSGSQIAVEDMDERDDLKQGDWVDLENSDTDEED